MNVPPRVVVHVAPAFARFVSGGPLVLIVTLSVDRRGAIIHRVPRPSLFAPVGVGTRITRGGEKISRAPVSIDTERHPTLVLGVTSRRLLVEVSAFFGADPRPATLELLLSTPFGDASGNAIHVAPEPPTDPERDALAAMRREVRPDEGFYDWVRRSGPSALDDAPLPALGQLALHRFVRRFRDAAGRVDDSDLDALPPALAPERAAFLVERAALLGQPFAAAARAVRALGVGLDAWMDDLERGYSWTGAFRRRGA